MIGLCGLDNLFLGKLKEVSTFFSGFDVLRFISKLKFILETFIEHFDLLRKWLNLPSGWESASENVELNPFLKISSPLANKIFFSSSFFNSDCRLTGLTD